MGNTSNFKLKQQLGAAIKSLEPSLFATTRFTEQWLDKVGLVSHERRIEGNSKKAEHI